ncbi:hypothetical protein OOT46_10350 [Aquabacterium sp. A7-Y]|uniref:hypothetical protein n=1 Tax=Aquabacterium sp. A7-Y TaxID=1349605 RepID=UPI00223E17F9|nr:hypothetical protein [Aquabacterium sp. A7-Y]MCW7538247.1 hypothetical protein [Aquabacterium sp. A7-Y]
MESAKHRWWMALTEPKYPQKDPGGNMTVREIVEALNEHRLAQNSAIRLSEGEVVDFEFWPDQGDRFLHFPPDTGEFVDAKKLVVEGIGRRYRVKNDTRNLPVFFKAWRDALARQDAARQRKGATAESTAE